LCVYFILHAFLFRVYFYSIAPIAFYEGTVKHIYFVAETKGTLESLQQRPIEAAKIKCARKLFNEISTSKVKYHDVTNYQELLDIMKVI
jgi:type III restriction enzyme